MDLLADGETDLQAFEIARSTSSKSKTYSLGGRSINQNSLSTASGRPAP